MKAKVVIFGIHKGGEGKTTSAFNLASFFAMKKGKKMLVIDLDSSANATITMVKNMACADRSLYDVVIGRCSMRDLVCETTVENLHIVPSGENMKGFARAISNESGADYRLVDILEGSGLVNEYDYIFVDSPPQLELITSNGLAAADYLVVPMQCTRYSVKGLVDILAEANKLKKRVNPKLCFLGAFISRFNVVTNIDRDVYKDIVAFFNQSGFTLFNAKIRETARVKESVLCRKPVFEYEKNCTAAWDYLALGEELFARLGGAEPTAIDARAEAEQCAEIPA